MDQSSSLATSAAVKKELRIFAGLALALEIVILTFYGGFVRMMTTLPADELAVERYGAYQDVNVMMLIGFGFAMTFMKSYALSSLSYTFFINAVVMQLYVLFEALWERVFLGFDNYDYYILIDQKFITRSSYCVTAVLIAFGGFIGRAGPKLLLIAAVIQVIAYSFNEVVNTTQIHNMDAGGSTTVHAFGAYYGLAVSWMLSRKRPPCSKPQLSSRSNTVAMIGTLFLWLYWPSINFGVYANNNYEQNQIVANTLYALTGSCISTFMTSSFMGKLIAMEDVLNATLAGGVIVGASTGFLYHPSLAIGIGIIGGIVSTLCFHFLSPVVEAKLAIYDTCGINNLHGIPGILGGIFGALIMASYQNSFDPQVSQAMSRINNPEFNRQGSYLYQALLQLIGTFASVGIAIAFGLLAGFIMSIFYDENPKGFFMDKVYIKVPQTEEVGDDQYSQQITQETVEVGENRQRLLAQ